MLAYYGKDRPYPTLQLLAVMLADKAVQRLEAHGHARDVPLGGVLGGLLVHLQAVIASACLHSAQGDTKMSDGLSLSQSPHDAMGQPAKISCFIFTEW